MRVESGGRTEMNGRPITSGAGAMGLMQVMPATYDELRRRYSLGGDPYDPHNSILAGTAYIRELYDLYGSPGFLAAYNGGPGRLDDYLTRNRALPEETRRYVAKIGPRIAGSFPDKRATSELYAMNSVPTSIPAGPRYAAPASAPAMAPEPAPVQAPVEVAFAPPSAGDGAFDPPPGWKPRGMPRAEANAYVPPPAALPPPPIPPAPVMVAEATPVAGYAPAPMPSRRAEADYPLPPAAPVALPARAPRAEPLPVPPAPVATVQTAAAYGYAPPPRSTGLHLMGMAQRRASADLSRFAGPVGDPGGCVRQRGAGPWSRRCRAGAGWRRAFRRASRGCRRAGTTRNAVSCPADRTVARGGDPGMRAPARPWQLHRALARLAVLIRRAVQERRGRET